MKTPDLRQFPRTDDDAFVFAAPMLLLTAVLAAGALTLTLGAFTAEDAPAAAAPAIEPLTSFVGA